MAMDQKRLAAWITDRLVEAPPAAVFVLVHASVESMPMGGGMGMGGDLQEVVLRERSQEGVTQEKDAERIAKKLWEGASAHSEAFSGTEQRYKIVAENADGGISATMPLVLGVKSRTTMGQDQFMHSEPATQTGLLGMLMRHNDSMQRNFMDALGGILGPLVSTCEQQRLRLQKYEEDRLEFMDRMERLSSLQHERDMEVIKVGSQNERRQKIVGKLADEVIPRLAAQFFAGKGGATVAALMMGAAAKEASSSSGSDSGSEAQGSGLGAQGSTNGEGRRSVPYYQERLREVFRVIDRKAISDNLSEIQAANLDGLLGMGEDPKSVSEYKQRFMCVMGELPKEVLDAIMARLTTEEHADKGVVFAELFGFAPPAAGNG